MRQTSTSGWTTVTVPNVWNLGDPSNESMSGGIGWYRKDFELPERGLRAGLGVRFESVNYRSQVWLNGTPRGREHRRLHPVRDGRQARSSATGTNRLVVRVDSRRKLTDFPPAA